MTLSTRKVFDALLVMAFIACAAILMWKDFRDPVVLIEGKSGAVHLAALDVLPGAKR